MANESEINPEVKNLLKDANNIDLDGIMNLAGGLLKNGTVLNTVSEIMKLNNSFAEPPTKQEITGQDKLNSLEKQIEEMNQEIANLKSELTQLKKYHEELQQQIYKMNKSTHKK